MIERHLKALLFDNDCVVLPGFGGFLTQYISADIHPITHKFQPPSRRVAFNEQLKGNDGLLVQAVAAAEKLEYTDALARVEEFVRNMAESLRAKRIFELRDIGRFFINSSERVEFEPDTSKNFLEDSFSLPELFFKPIERNTLAVNKNQRPAKPAVHEPGETKEKQGTAPALRVLLPMALFLLAGATAFFFLSKSDKNLAELNPFAVFSKKDTSPVAAAPAHHDEPVHNPSVAETPAAADEETLENADEKVITARTGRYFVVIGSFKSKENALKYREKLEAKDIEATVLEPSDKKNFYRVSVADFSDKDSARKMLEESKATYGKSVWILSY